MVPAPGAQFKVLKLSKIDHYLIDNVVPLRLSQLEGHGQEEKGGADWALQ
jgi:hypothetical protein